MKRVIEIKSIASFSVAKFLFLTGSAIAVLRIVFNILSYLRGKSDVICNACTINFIFGITVGMAFVGLVLCFVYNRVASRFGGIELNIEDTE